MPITYLYTSNTYALECTDCHTTVALPAWMRGTPAQDDTVGQTFRWHAGNQRYLNRCRTCERAHVARWRENRRVPAATVEAGPSLGLNRSFGVELELIFPSTIYRETVTEALRGAGLSAWRVKSDGSLAARNGHGLEIVSPILRGENGLQQIRTACEILSGLGAKPNRTCGMHVHHDISDLDVESIKRMVTTWTRNQGVIDRLVSPSRRSPGASQYCQRLASSEVSCIMASTTLREMQMLRRVSRYRTFNLVSYGRYGTVEIRQHQGTVEPSKIINWILFGQAVIERSRASAVDTTRTVPTFLEQLAGHLNESARDYLLRRETALAGAVA